MVSAATWTWKGRYLWIVGSGYTACNPSIMKASYTFSSFFFSSAVCNCTFLKDLVTAISVQLHATGIMMGTWTCRLLTSHSDSSTRRIFNCINVDAAFFQVSGAEAFSWADHYLQSHLCYNYSCSLFTKPVIWKQHNSSLWSYKTKNMEISFAIFNLKLRTIVYIHENVMQVLVDHNRQKSTLAT